jgi:large subunit ribosomal protein L9
LLVASHPQFSDENCGGLLPTFRPTNDYRRRTNVQISQNGVIEMEVILKEDVAKLGARGEVVKVAEGYGRNFLLPKKLAIEATVGNKTVIEQMKAASVRRSAKEKSEAEALSKQFDGLEVSFTRKSGENDQLFGSVTASDIPRRSRRRASTSIGGRFSYMNRSRRSASSRSPSNCTRT